MEQLATPRSLPRAKKQPKKFSVPNSFYWLIRGVNAAAPLFMGLGNLESKVLASRIRTVHIDRPIYICGLSRAGTTISAQMLSEHPDVTTHRYSDFVMPYMPWCWNRLLPKLPTQALRTPMERIHRDRLEVTRDSAEDVEEMIWERFTDRFQGVPDKNTENPDFEQFFTNHIRKLLLVRGRNRYMTKSILGASRLQYLKRIFPDVRILLYIRHPIDHVASMMKQDRLWQEISRTDPRQIKLTQITGHHGFGPDYVPLNVGNAAAVEEICRCRDAGHAARARALQWASVYGSLMELLKNDAALASAVCVVRYEDLCANASETMDRILGHTGLCPNAFAATRDSYLAKLSLPDYYCPKFSPQEMADITMVTKDVAGKFGYDIQNIPGSLV